MSASLVGSEMCIRDRSSRHGHDVRSRWPRLPCMATSLEKVPAGGGRQVARRAPVAHGIRLFRRPARQAGRLRAGA
eukprot:12793467-Alexandrium_andersonii.AAC.1